jgi:Fuc2NAc and GlcNAc transferase
MGSFGALLLVVALMLSAGITGIVKAYAARIDLLDIPNQRSSHVVPTPRGGGLSIVIVFFGALLIFWLADHVSEHDTAALMLGGGLIAAIGFADDHRHIPAGWRFLIQVIAATMTVALLGGLSTLPLGDGILKLGIAGNILVVVFMVWFTNAFNFMDGIDGIAASESICIAGGVSLIAIGSGVGVIALLWAALAAASLGFLAWNLPPAKIFMGDVGSSFLGFTLFGLSLYSVGTETLSLWSWLILAGVFIVDAAITLTTRLLRRDDWLSAHRSHAYQRAARRYRSHGRVTVAVICINVCWLLPLAWLAQLTPERGWWLTLVAWCPLVALTLWLGAGQQEE